MYDNAGKTELIIHGHFYQPARENPRTGLIGQHMTFSPWLNWNEKIFHDCYSANANSRYLSGSGRILSITNNFNWISQDFGPALLCWLEKYHPGTYEHIIDSDRVSLERLGHGSALATTFSNTILPLDPEHKARLQIEWGITDFEKRYGRRPEGFWLPDAAISPEIIDILTEFGIVFVVLPSGIAKSIELPDGTVWELGETPAPSTEAFLIEGTHGNRLSCFFSDKELSNGISFRHYLRSADELYDRLLKMRETNGHRLIQCVTAGEIYGHFEPYGDMALAAMIRKVEERDDFMLTNYASYLEAHPAKKLVELKYEEGPDGKRWTCLHGMSRWYAQSNSDSFKSTKWMTGMRHGFNNLNRQIDWIYEAETKRIFGGAMDPWHLLSLASDVITGHRRMESFMEELHERYDFPAEADSDAANLILGEKMMSAAFTSGGFFYEDKQGLEARQNIRYALQTVKAYQKFINGDLLLPFLADIRKARSAVEASKNGMEISLEILNGMKGEDEAALAFYLNRRLASQEERIDRYGIFVLIERKDLAANKDIRVRNEETLTEYRFSILSSSSMDNGINLYISKETVGEPGQKHLRIETKDVPKTLMNQCYDWIDGAMNRTAYREVRDMIRSLFHYSILVRNTGMEAEKAKDTNENIGVALKIIKSTLILSTEGLVDPDIKHQMGILIEFITKQGEKADVDSLRNTMDRYMDLIAYKIWESGLTEDIVSHILSGLLVTRKNGLEPNTTKIQNEVYPYYTGERKCTVRSDRLSMLYDSLNFA